jgi:hypothetical protein
MVGLYTKLVPGDKQNNDSRRVGLLMDRKEDYGLKSGDFLGTEAKGLYEVILLLITRYYE